VGVFGGAFDPPHCAHVALAEAAIKQLQLDELRIIPTGQAWHKTRPLSPAEQRLKMTELAFLGLQGVTVDTRELDRPGPSYTIETLEALQAEQPESEFFLVMGADQLAAFRQWRRWQDILAFATLCVAERPRQTGESDNLTPQASDLLPSLRLQIPLNPVSATTIRQQIASQAGPNRSTSCDVTGLLPEAVARYISRHGLYQAPSTPQ
jgi:nicotinate-nucleotide adenylyltransferase